MASSVVPGIWRKTGQLGYEIAAKRRIGNYGIGMSLAIL